MGLETQASLPSKLIFGYIWKLVFIGWRRPLETSDLEGVLEDCDGCALNTSSLQANLSSSSHNNMKTRLLYGLIRLAAYDMAAAGVGKLLGDLLGFIQPLAVTGILNFLLVRGAGGRDAEWGVPGAQMEMGYWWFIAVVISSLLQNLCLHRQHHHSIRAGLHARSALSGLVFEKMLKLTPTSRLRFGSGKVQNLGTVDPNSVGMLCWYFHYTWAAPMQLAISMAMLYSTLGPSSFVGLAALVALVPLQGYIGSLLTSLTKKVLVKTDARLKLSSEALTGVRLVKVLGLESSFIERIVKERLGEVSEKWWVALTSAMNTAAVEGGPLVASILALTTYGMTASAPLSPPTAFTALALFQILRLPIMLLPMLTGQIASAQASLGRLSEFLAAPEIFDYRKEPPQGKAAQFTEACLRWGAAASSSGDTVPVPQSSTSSPSSDSAIIINNEFSLDLDDVSIPAGGITAVVGPVGSGKSSLLAALLGDLTLERGIVKVQGGARRGVDNECRKDPAVEAGSARSSPTPIIGYAAQTPFILNCSVRDNILFGSSYDPERYASVLADCALVDDLATLEQGDATEIGERGINLSGGQKARLSLARALYSPASLILLDDPLSAVDASTGSHLWIRALKGPLGCYADEKAGRRRSIVLVTHSTDVLPFCDYILVLDSGRVVQRGPFSEINLPAARGGDAVTSKILQAALPVAPLLQVSVGEGEVERKTTTKGVEKEFSPPPLATSSKTLPKPTAATKDRGVLISEEGRFRGSISSSLYLNYLSLMGGPLGFSLMATLLTSTVGRILVDWILAYWSTDALKLSVSAYAGMYCGVSIGAIGLSFLSSFLWAHSGLLCAVFLHDAMLQRVMRSPISFFDTTPIGRVINRFSSDVGILDKDLPTAMASASSLLLRILGTLVVQAVILPWTLLGTTPLTLLYLAIYTFYRASARELKRLDLASKSLAATLFVECSVGQSTIAAWGAEGRFQSQLEQGIDINSRAYWAGNVINRWLGLRLDWLGGLLLGVIVAAALANPASSDVGLTGLAITYAMGVAGLLNWAVRSATDCESLLSSAQRVFEYTEAIPIEASPVTSLRPPPGWPTSGEVVFTNFSARYRPDLPPCLSGVTLRVPAGAKVGVVGRTGSGKSSLTLALFRVLEAEAGRIEIDGLNLAALGLDDLRKSLAIVPQDPTLFSGTLRKVLDPLDEHSDEELGQVLITVQFPGDGTLGSRIEEGGSNLSQGERQLLCLARALLRKSKVVVLDESTASIDKRLDFILQKNLRTLLAHSTVFVVAHRLATVMDSDFIAVMAEGGLAEWGTPRELASVEGGRFANLLKESRDNL